MRRSFRFLAILACAMPLACADSSAPTAPVPAPSFSANPESNGSLLIRYTTTGLWWSGWYDPSRDQIAIVTNRDAPPLCFSQTPTTSNDVDWKVVSSGNIADLYHVVAKVPEVFVYIFDGGWDTWWPIRCAPIMSGTGTAMLTDNDYATAGNGVEAFGYMASGQVTDGEGQAYRFSGHFRVLFSPNGNHEQGFINLQPLK